MAQSMNDWIRQQAGYGPPAQPEAEAAPPKRADANAGAGAHSAGVGSPRLDMNQMIREARFGGRHTWTVYGG